MPRRPKTPLPPLRLWLFRGLTLLGVVASIELGSLVLLRLVDPTPARGDAVQVALPLPVAERWRTEQALHPYLGFVADPLRSPDAWTARFHPEAKDFGFPRNLEGLFHEPADDRVVVGLFGGSVAAILATAGRPELRRQLAARHPAKEIVIISLGFPGFKQPQQLMALNYFLALGGHLDLVLNLDGFNDVVLPVSENLEHGVHYAYPRGWRFRVDELQPDVRRGLGKLEYLKALRAKLDTALATGAFRRSPTVRLLRRSLDRYLDARITASEAALAARWGSGEGMYQALGPTRRPEGFDAVLEASVELWRRSSSLMRRQCAASGIEYHHFLQPNQYATGAEGLLPEDREVAFSEDQPYRPAAEAGYPLLRAAGRDLDAEGVAFHDLTAVFDNEEQPVYSDDCCHLNLHGNRLLAAAIGKALARPGGPGPRSANDRR